MTHQTTTYNNSGNRFLPSSIARLGKGFLLFLLMMVMGVGSAWGQTTPSKWDGTKPTENWSAAIATAAGITGAGTEADPYVIHDAKGFVCFWWASNNGKLNSSTQYWKLDADIDLNNTSWPYVNKNGTFKGKFDGQNHTISNMNLVPPTANLNYGLFCAVEGESANKRAEVKNLTLDNAKIAPSAELKETTSVGFVVGKSNKYADFDNVKVTNSNITYVKNINNSNYVGGIAGQTLTDTKLTNCSVSTLGITTSGKTTNAYFGGLIGYIGSQTTVSGCSTSDVTITYNTIANASRISGFIGYAKGTTADPIKVNGCTVTKTKIDLTKGINDASYIGGLLAQNENCILFGDGTEGNKNTVESPIINIAVDIKKASYIGGAFGQVKGASGNEFFINGLKVNSPSITINKNSIANTYAGDVFGHINTYGDVNNVTVDKPSLAYNNDGNTNFALCLGTFAGYIQGNTTKEVSITNVNITGTAQLTLGTEAKKATTEVKNVRAGLIGMATTNVLLDKWDVNKSVIDIKGSLSTTQCHIGGFAGNLTGANAAPTTARNITLSNSEVHLTGNAVGASNQPHYIGGLVGYATTNLCIESCTSNNSTINVDGEIKTNVSYIGGAIGDFVGGAGNISTINGLTVENPSVTVNKNSIANSNVGGVFGRIGNYSIVNGVTAKSPSVTYNNDGSPNFALNIGSFAGYILGSAQQETVVTGTKVEGTAQVTIDDEANKAGNVITNIKAGLNGQVSTNVRLDEWTIENSSVKANGNLGATSGTTASYIGGFAGYMVSAANSPLNISGITISGNSNVDISGNIAIDNCYLGGFAGYIYDGDAVNAPVNIDQASIEGTSTVHVGGAAQKATYMGGFAGYIYGKTKAGSTLTINKVTLSKSDVSIDGETSTASYYGGMAGRVNTACNLNNWEVTTESKVSIKKVSKASYIGGAIGSVDGATNYPAIVTDVSIKGLNILLDGDLTDAIYVGGIVGQLQAIGTTPNKIEKAKASGKISITGSRNYTTGSKDRTYAFGGIVGYTKQSSTTFSEVNQCISEVDFDLSKLTPSTTSNFYSGFVVGGVIGRLEAPSRLPEQLFYGGKIYAPSAAVGPIVGVFCTNLAADTYIYDDYSGENASNITNEWAKADTWFYNGYKIGLSKDLLDETTRTKNYTGSSTVEDGVSYLLVGDLSTTFSDKNKIGTNDKNSYTILAYTVNNSDVDKGIYPKWTANTATYPAYYMYYMQGVNRGTYTSTPAETKKAILEGTLTIMTLVDDKGDLTIEGNRGFVSHKLTATTSTSVSIDSYKWYVNGTQQSETSNVFSYTPDIAVNTVAVEAIKGGKVVKRLECKVMPVFRVQYASEALGTSSNPYLIGSAQDLQLLTYLSTLPSGVAWEKDYDSYTHYNKAYYKMDGDVDLSAIDDFAPIGLNKAAYSQNFIFDGVFDGDTHTISGLKETWYSGIWNTNDANDGWGLFAFVGNPNATVKVGDSSASNAVIKNLVIDGATLTHDTNNTTFFYNNGTSNANNCHVGILAGVVTSNTTIQNIEIRNSQITDNGSPDYSLATKGLFVGGAIGSMQNAFNATANCATNTRIDHIAAQVDITLNHPTFTSGTTRSDYLGVFNIGGIIGRYWATGATWAQVQNTMPAYTFYSGNITATKAWISPVLAAVRYVDQQSFGSNGNSMASFSKQWEGNNNSAATQLTITNAQYYNFRINGELMTELRPATACARGARPVMEHTDATETADTYNAQKYQGVNYSARFIDSDVTTLYFLNQNPVDNIYWVWENEFEFPHMTDQKPNEAYLTRNVNAYTANMVEGSGSSYHWQISYDGETWIDIDGTEQTQTVLETTRPKLVVAIITIGGTEYRTQVETILAGTNPFDVHIAKTGDSVTGYTFNVVWKDGNEPSVPLTTTYQWYKSDQKTTFDGQTSASLTLSQSILDAAGGYIWCAVNVKEMGTSVYNWMLVAGDLKVVYVNGNGYNKNGAKTGVDTNNGRTPQTPVKTIKQANSLLDGGPWDKNIIVVMGILDNDYVFNSSGTNPATLTGKWDGVDYEGVIRLKENGKSDASNPAYTGNGLNGYVLGDTKFENLTIEGDNSGNVFIECHGNNVTFGKGLRMKNFSNLSEAHSNLDKQIVPEFSIILTSTNPTENDIKNHYTNRTTPQVVTFESGHYGRILAGRYTGSFFPKADNTSHSILGSAENPIWAVLNIDIDKDNIMQSADDTPKNYTCDINCIVAGLTDGTMYGDFEINVRGGDIRYIVGGNQGNPVINGSKTFTQVGGNSGNWGQWPNSSYFGRTVINVEQDEKLKDIHLENIYAGGLGRLAQDDNAKSVVDMYMYGHTEVNMKSGTVAHNIYGGGAGGVIGVNPWDAHAPYETSASDDDGSAIRNGVQYGDNRLVSGAWSNMTPDSPMAKVRLRNLNDGGTGYDNKYIDLRYSTTELNISGGTIGGNIYGGGCGFVSNMDGGVTPQGVGSVFGISNVDITGGIIKGSVYGGSQGDTKYFGAVNKYGQTIDHIAEMDGTINVNITGTSSKYPIINGDIYGAGMGIKTSAVASTATQADVDAGKAENVGDTFYEEYLRIATAGNYDLAGQNATDEQKKKFKTNINITIDMPASIEFPNDIYGGGALGKVDGNTNIILKQGTFTGNIYGGGYGELNHKDKAMVTGTTNIYTGAVKVEDVDSNLPVSVKPSESDATKVPTIYGGGNMAQVTGNTYINIWHGNITADVYGGGRGLSEAESKGYTGYGWVIGNTRVLYNNTTTGNKLIGNIYGGGALGAVVGSGTGQDKGTTVVIKAGEIIGDVFGGGRGETGSDKAKVTGNTNVIVDSTWGDPEPTPTPDPTPQP